MVSPFSSFEIGISPNTDLLTTISRHGIKTPKASDFESVLHDCSLDNQFFLMSKTKKPGKMGASYSEAKRQLSDKICWAVKGDLSRYK